MKFHGAGTARSVQFRTIIVRWSSRRNPPPGRSSGSLHPASSEAASAGAGTEGLQRRLPLLSHAARRETEIEQASHVIGIKIECCRGHRIIGLNGSKAKLPPVAVGKGGEGM